ncbi:MAG TPA: C1 family peptidase [Flavobacteriales bacterium]|nr:C1 family peptidase [Flavobacteriales bacterium]
MKKIIIAAMLPTLAIAQQKDKGTFIEKKPGYYQNSILKGISDDQEKAKPEPIMEKSFKIDLTGVDLPTDITKYTTIWHNNPVSQGNTSTCWCFATTSYYESEVKRLTGKEIKLSEIYTVYWEYVERAKYFVQNRGEMNLGEGSETMAVGRQMKKYGAVPLSVYSGMMPGKTVHTHEKMFAEIDAYLKGVKERNAWNEEEVVKTVRSILDYHIGKVPEKFTWEGKEYTPVDFVKNVLKINPDEYVDIMSLKTEEYWKKAEYKVEDNWWKSKDYLNIPLDDFTGVIKNAIKNGYGIAIGGDVGEPGFETGKQVAVVPSFDIPSEYINDDARAMRFLNKSTTDDHAMHIVGYTEKDGKTWYLVKDSGAGSRNCGKECKSFGYYFFHEDYVKLKIMTFTIHKDAAREILRKVN